MDAPVTPERLDRRYWECITDSTVTMYADLDIMFDNENAVEQIHNIRFTGLSPIKLVVGDGEFIASISVEHDTMLLINKTNGDIWTYVKGSEEIIKKESSTGEADEAEQTFVNAGSFSSSEELIKYGFKKGKVYILDITQPIIPASGDLIYVDTYIGRRYYDGPQATDSDILELVPFTQNGTCWSFNLNDGSCSKTKTSNSEQTVINAGYFHNMKELQDYGFEEGKIYILRGTNDLYNINLIGEFIGMVFQGELRCFKSDLSVSLTINLASGEVVDYYNSSEHPFENLLFDVSSYEELLEYDEFKVDKLYKFNVLDEIHEFIPSGCYIGRYFYDVPIYDAHVLEFTTFIPDGKVRVINFETGECFIKDADGHSGGFIETIEFIDIDSFTKYNFVDGKIYNVIFLRDITYSDIDIPFGEYVAIAARGLNGTFYVDFRNRHLDGIRYRYYPHKDFLYKDVIKSAIEDAGNYYESDEVEGALQEIGATLSGLEDFLASI
jgi:hypothetical protein